MDQKTENAIRVIGDILKMQKLTIQEHEIAQDAFRTLVEGIKNGGPEQDKAE